MKEHIDEAGSGFDTVLVLDFGAQYGQLIARRVRECRVYSQLVPHDLPVEEIAARKPKGLIFSGGPMSVYVDGAPRPDPRLYELGVPILGICYGAQLMALQLGGTVAKTGVREFGKTQLRVTRERPAPRRPRRRGAVLDEPRRRHRGRSRGFHHPRDHRPRPRRRHGGPRARLLRRAVPPRGRAHAARHGRPQELPLRGLRLHARRGPRRRSSRSRSSASASRSVPTTRRSSACRAASTRRSPPCSSTRPSATASPASSSTRA